MFPHELEDPPVSFCGSLCPFWSLAKGNLQIAAFLYTPEGKVVAQRAWEETLAELTFAGVHTILESMKA
jgi:hypothetical protein